MTNTIFYSIPDAFFPGYRVVHPFHAKVKYEYDYQNKKVTIADVCLSPLCLKSINTKGLVERMEMDIAEAERKKLINPVNRIVMEALAPHI